MWTRKRTSKEAPPEPFTRHELAVIMAAQSSFQVFLQQVYPLSFEGKKFRMADKKYHPFSLGAAHYVWARLVEEHPRVCILAPRAHLKSTVLNHAFAFWKLFSAKENVDGVIMSYKDSLAQEHTTKLKEVIQNNRYCRFWIDRKPMAESVVDYDISFGQGKSWRGQVDPYGVMSTVRGLHPKFLICDDILSDFANALEPTSIKRIDTIFRQSLESLPDEGDSLVVIGTPQSYEDTLYRLADNDEYVWARFPAEKENGETLWPEKFDVDRLRRTRRRILDTAYEVEYMLVPVLAVNSFIPQTVVENNCDIVLKPASLDVPFVSTGIIGMYGGMDVGKHIHPTHVSIGALMPTGDIVQVYQEFLDGMDYNQQSKHIRRLIAHFGVKRFYYDSTRGEMEDRHMSRRAIGVTFTQKSKAHLALGMESRFYAGPDEPGIVLLHDRRQIGQIVSVDRTLKAIATAEGHGDSFWSVALMIKAADDGPVMQVLGNAQDTFGNRRVGRPVPTFMAQ